MGEQYSSQDYSQADASYLLRDLEERQRLLKDRLLIIGKSLVDERDKNFSEIQQIKKDLALIKEEHSNIKELLQRVTEQLSNVARREELLIIQRQLDLLRSGQQGESNGNS